jgi:hypothetical protein
MPLFVTCEVFACGCAVESYQITGGNGCPVIRDEVLPADFRCLRCIFTTGLASLGYAFVCILESVARELSLHLHLRAGSPDVEELLQRVFFTRDMTQVYDAFYRAVDCY